MCFFNVYLTFSLRPDTRDSQPSTINSFQDFNEDEHLVTICQKSYDMPPPLSLVRTPRET